MFKDSQVFCFRIEGEDLRLIERAAESAGMQPAEWAREKLIAAARRAAK